jgi:hypothetical protein
MNSFHRTIAGAALLLLCHAAQAQGGPPPTRGELLYTTHCLACHTKQLHWRNQSVATDWETLKAQVRRWQHTVGLQWSEADIVEVARYLNETIYHHPQPADRVSRADPSSRP